MLEDIWIMHFKVAKNQHQVIQFSFKNKISMGYLMIEKSKVYLLWRIWGYINNINGPIILMFYLIMLMCVPWDLLRKTPHFNRLVKYPWQNHLLYNSWLRRLGRQWGGKSQTKETEVRVLCGIGRPWFVYPLNTALVPNGYYLSFLRANPEPFLSVQSSYSQFSRCIKNSIGFNNMS